MFTFCNHAEDDLYEDDDDYYDEDDDYDDGDAYVAPVIVVAPPKPAAAPRPVAKPKPTPKSAPAPAGTGKAKAGAAVKPATSTPIAAAALPGPPGLSRGSTASSTTSSNGVAIDSPAVDSGGLLSGSEEVPLPADDKPCLSLIIAGHVDVGKSTLLGHFLYKVGVIDERLVRKFQRESAEIGKGSFAFAWVLDQNDAEVCCHMEAHCHFDIT